MNYPFLILAIVAMTAIVGGLASLFGAGVGAVVGGSLLWIELARGRGNERT